MDNKRQELIDKVRRAISEKNSEEDILKIATELIDGYSEAFNWTGFYLMRGNMLEIGPYLGPVTEHMKIPLDSGICGAAASQKQTVIVDDVNTDPRFLACSLTTRSEIVVPLMDGDICLGEIDIDSDRPSNFTIEDKQMLEAIAAIIVDRLKDIKK